MMRKFTSITHRLFNNAQTRAFSSTNKPDSHHVDDVVIVTKHNPFAEKDLRGYEHIDKLNETEKSYSPLHSTVPDPFAAYSIFQSLPNSITRLLSRFMSHPKSNLASDSLYLPKITENGIPIYDSVSKATSTYLIINKMWIQVFPLFILALSPLPALSTFTYGLISYAYYNTNWKFVRNLAIKVELSPQTEEIIYQKISIFGKLNTFRVSTSDVEFTTLSDVFGEDNHSERSVRGLLNRDVVLRIKSSNELVFFDKGGIWHQDGINHPLLL